MLDEVIDEGSAAVGHFGVEVFDAVQEIVEAPDCRERHEQPDGRVDQRLGDAAGHGGDPSLSCPAHGEKRVHDADDGAE